MLAAYVEKMGLPEPLDGLAIDERPEPSPPEGWEIVSVRAAALNRHDLWTLAGVTVRPVTPPVILGCDAAGLTADGREIVVYPVLDHGPRFRMLTDGVDGAFAPRMAVPSTNLVPKPAHLSFEEAAALPTAWLTAWSMLFARARLQPGERVLVQGASGGLATAAVMLASAAGAHVTVTSRHEATLDNALAVGAHDALLTGDRLRERVDVVIDTVGAATWAHSLRSLRYGGRLVCSGATSGPEAITDVRYIFGNDLSILGHKMGSLADFVALCGFVSHAGLRPPVSRVYEGVASVREALAALADGDVFGKLVVRIS